MLLVYLLSLSLLLSEHLKTNTHKKDQITIKKKFLVEFFLQLNADSASYLYLSMSLDWPQTFDTERRERDSMFLIWLAEQDRQIASISPPCLQCRMFLSTQFFKLFYSLRSQGSKAVSHRGISTMN